MKRLTITYMIAAFVAQTPVWTQNGSGVQAEWVRHYGSGLFPGIDVARAIALDGSGHVYVAGYGSSSPFGTNYVVAHHDASGNQLWVAHYGVGQENNQATALAVDAARNVYVTGFCGGFGSGLDYTTIKYNRFGVQQWVSRHNGSGNADDRATAIAVDSLGNVYVTGSSVGSNLNSDYTTIKYDSSGIALWVAHYNGPGNDADFAKALAIDDSGNVYVTGESTGPGTAYDYATIKYNSTGAQQWIKRYDGFSASRDDAAGLTIDHAGNVYVTGGSDGDYVTIKYNATGATQWLARYDAPGYFNENAASAIVVDDYGNVYVTGGIGGVSMRAYVTIKYNVAGAEQWVAKFKSPELSRDEATALAVDRLGNVYVTGKSGGSGTGDDYTTIKYDSSGVEQWVARYNGSGNGEDVAVALAIDDNQNVLVTGRSRGASSADDFATIKYDPNGIEQWTRRYDGSGSSYDVGAALALDKQRNSYVAGRSRSTATGDDYLVIKYNTSGTEQWTVRYDGAEHADDTATDLCVDAAGNVYVTGNSEATATRNDYATVKYDSSGVEQWVGRYNGQGNSYDFATALAVDDSGSVYVTGSSYGFTYDFATIKYNAYGIQQWIALYDGHSTDQATAIAVDNVGNVYVTGMSYGFSSGSDYLTIKYSSSGERQWVARYDGPGHGYDEATALAIDGYGNVFVTGMSTGGYGKSDFATIKYDLSGIQKWVARYDGPMNLHDQATALAVDNLGSVYVTGGSERSFGITDFATVKYSSNGIEQWAARYDGKMDNAQNAATALVVDNFGNVYVTGKSSEQALWDSYTTIKYDSSGTEQWLAHYKGPGEIHHIDDAPALQIDDYGSVYVAGTSSSTDWSVITTLKYTETPVSVNERKPVQLRTFSLSQNYPNPFNPETAIRYQLQKDAYVRLQIYSVEGRLVRTVVEGMVKAGESAATWDGRNEFGQPMPSGVYFCRLTVNQDEWMSTKKMVLVR